MSNSTLKKSMLFLLAITYLIFIIENFLYLDPVYATVSSDKFDYLSSNDGVLQNLPIKNGDNISVGDILFEFRRFPKESEQMKQVRTRLEDIVSEIKVLDLVRIDLEERLKQVSINDHQIENSLVALYNPSQTTISFLEQKLINLQELSLMASERLAIERNHYQEIMEGEKNSLSAIVRAAQSGKVLIQNIVPGSTILAGVPILSVLNCQALSVDLFFKEADANHIQIGGVVSFSISGSRDIWKSTISESPINIDLLNAKQKFNLPSLPSGHWYRVRATPEANFISWAQNSKDCLVGRNVVASIPRESLISFVHAIIP